MPNAVVSADADVLARVCHPAMATISDAQGEKRGAT